jgi:hypothetical protein
MVNMKKPTRLENQLFLALLNLMQELFADGPTRQGEHRANRALAHFTRIYGNRDKGR